MSIQVDGMEAALLYAAEVEKREALEQRITALEAENAKLRAGTESGSEIGWLLEVQGPAYLGRSDEGIVSWTNKHEDALRFARKQDAEMYAELEGLTAASAVEHMWCHSAAGIGETGK